MKRSRRKDEHRRSSRPAPEPRTRQERIEEDQRWKASLLAAFVARNGWPLRPRTVVQGVDLERWAVLRRVDHRRRRLAPWLRDALEAIPGWSWDPFADKRRALASRIEAYVTTGARHGLDVAKLEELGRWLRWRRREHLQGRIDPALDARLRRIPGWSWAPRRKPGT
jgi:hypothetical protein